MPASIPGWCGRERRLRSESKESPAARRYGGDDGPERSERVGGDVMSILQTVEQPAESPTVPARKPSALPGPVQFVVRAIATLWSNRKARVGLVLLGIFILIAVFAPVLAPDSPT